MFRVLISIITKEDSENAISNDLETQEGVWPTKFNKLPTPWVTQLWYLHKHTMQVHLTDQIRSIKAQCKARRTRAHLSCVLVIRNKLDRQNFLVCGGLYAVYPKICFRKCSHFSPRSGKIQLWKYIDHPTSTYDTTPNFLSPTTICHLSTLSIVWSLFVDAHPQTSS
jgi:hypothetical protein